MSIFYCYALRSGGIMKVKLLHIYIPPKSPFEKVGLVAAWHIATLLH